MQTARDLVALAAEFPAGVQHGQHDFCRGLVLVLGMVVHRDATPVVGDAAGPVREQRHVDPVRVAGHRFVDGVVHDLVDQVVQTGQTGRTDVHTRAFSDRFEALQHRDVFRPVRHARNTSHGSLTGGPIRHSSWTTQGRRRGNRPTPVPFRTSPSDEPLIRLRTRAAKKRKSAGQQGNSGSGNLTRTVRPTSAFRRLFQLCSAPLVRADPPPRCRRFLTGRRPPISHGPRLRGCAR